MFHPRGPTFLELSRQCLSSTVQGYNLLAPKFDYTPFRTPDDVLRVVGERIAAAGMMDDALDVCCGTGAAMRMLQPLCKRRLAGLDFSRGMLDTARKTLAANGQVGASNADATPRIELHQADALAMPFENEFDLAVCFGALGHIARADEPRFIGQLARVLRPGGRFVFITTSMPPWCTGRYLFSRAFNGAMHLRNWLHRPPFVMYYLTFLLPDIARLLDDAGFDVEIERDLFRGALRSLCLVTATLRR